MAKFDDGKPKFTYFLVEHRPRSEGGPLEFISNIEDLQNKPDLWESSCPYNLGSGRITNTCEDDW